MTHRDTLPLGVFPVRLTDKTSPEVFCQIPRGSILPEGQGLGKLREEKDSGGVTA